MGQPRREDGVDDPDDGRTPAGVSHLSKLAVVSEALEGNLVGRGVVRLRHFRRSGAASKQIQAPRQTSAKPVFGSDGHRGHRDRMRKRLLNHGPDTFADYELLEMFLFLAQPTTDTKPTAKRLLNRFGSFARVVCAPIKELTAIPNVGWRTASALHLLRAAAYRFISPEPTYRPILSDCDQVMSYLGPATVRDDVKQFRILLLDKRFRLIADELQCPGTIDHAPLYVREITKRALEVHASYLILVHNDTTGDPRPSDADVNLTQRIKGILVSLGVTLSDHIILGENGSWVSLRREGIV